jgi:SOS response regulatory protein OraA/RecX
MNLFEWNWDDAKEVWQQEARAEGFAEARAESRREILDLLEQGYTAEQIKAMLSSGDLPLDEKK